MEMEKWEATTVGRVAVITWGEPEVIIDRTGQWAGIWRHDPKMMCDGDDSEDCGGGNHCVYRFVTVGGERFMAFLACSKDSTEQLLQEARITLEDALYGL